MNASRTVSRFPPLYILNAILGVFAIIGGGFWLGTAFNLDGGVIATAVGGAVAFLIFLFSRDVLHGWVQGFFSHWSATLVLLILNSLFWGLFVVQAQPEPDPTPTPTPTVTTQIPETETPTDVPTATAPASAQPTVTPTNTNQPTMTRSDTPTNTSQPPTVQSTPTATTSITPSLTYTATFTATPTATEDLASICEPQVDSLFAPNYELWQSQCSQYFIRYLDLENNSVISFPVDLGYSNPRYVRLVLVPCISDDGLNIPEGCPFYATSLITRVQFDTLQGSELYSGGAQPDLMLTNPDDALVNGCRALAGEHGQLVLQSQWVVLEDNALLLALSDIGVESEITYNPIASTYHLNDGATAYNGSTSMLDKPFRCVIDYDYVVQNESQMD